MWLSVILPKIDNNNNKDDNCPKRTKPNNLSKTTVSFLVGWSMDDRRERRLSGHWMKTAPQLPINYNLLTYSMVDGQSTCINLGPFMNDAAMAMD